MLPESPTFAQNGAVESACFAPFSGANRISIRALAECGVAPALKRLGLENKQEIRILEIGGGPGRSAWATPGALLELRRALNLRIFRTGPDEGSIGEGRTAVACGNDVELCVPEVVGPAQALPFASNSVHLVVGHQVLHWMDGEQLPRSFREAYRVLKPGGTLVHATCGLVDLQAVNSHHFTRHTFVMVTYLDQLEHQLTSKGYWDRKTDGTLAPRNVGVNPAYHRYTLVNIRQWLHDAGFLDANIEVSMSMFPCNTAEIEARLAGNAAAVSTYFFQSDRLKAIPEEEKMTMARAAFEAAKKKVPRLFATFDNQNLDVTIGSVADRTYGEPIPIIVTTK